MSPTASSSTVLLVLVPRRDLDEARRRRRLHWPVGRGMCTPSDDSMTLSCP